MGPPYPNRDRALHQLARGEHHPTHRSWRTPPGMFAEEHDFPGQSFTITMARVMAAHKRVQERLAAQLAAAPQEVRALLRQVSPTGAEFARGLQTWARGGVTVAEATARRRSA